MAPSRSIGLFALLLLLLPSALAQNGTEDGNATAADGPREPIAPLDLISDSEYYLGILEQYVSADLALFLAVMAFWMLLGLIVILIVGPLLKYVLSKTPTHLDQHIFGIISKPAFLLIFAFGIIDSLRVFVLPEWLAGGLEKTWAFLFIVGVTYVVYRLWHEIILEVGDKVSAKTENELDDKLFPLFNKVGGVVIIVGGVFFILDGLGVNLTFFAAGGAVISLVVAFAAQDTLGNLFAGIFILLDQPFREGDRIEIQEEDTWGDVVDIGLRTTRIRTRDNRMVVVPNSIIGSNPVINHSFPDPLYRYQSDIGIAYGSDIETARTGMRSAVATVEGIDKDRPIDALFIAFGDNALVFRVRWWMASYEDLRRVQDQVHTAIDAELRRLGVEIPFPQRDVWFKNAPEDTRTQEE